MLLMPLNSVKLVINARGTVSVVYGDSGKALDIYVTSGWRMRHKRVYLTSPWIPELLAALRIERL